MDKIAIVKLNPQNIEMQFVDVVKNKWFVVYRNVSLPVNILKDFKTDNFIKPAIIKEVKSVLTIFKKMIDAEGITETLCYAGAFMEEAKNNNGFLNELFAVTGLQFSVLTAEEEINYIYTAVINTFNKPKGLIINISNFYTTFLLYNRRNILNTKTIPYGYENVYETHFANKSNIDFQNVSDTIYNEIKDEEWLLNLQEEFEVIGAGNMFLNLGTISRKARKYPLDLAHNYSLNKENFDKVYGVLKAQDVTKSTKVKGVSMEDSRYLQSAFAIMDGVLSHINKDTLSISRTGFAEGVLFNNAIPLTIEKPISDTLGYSLQVLNDYYDRKPNNTQHVYDVAMILFKQLKVLHKLGRPYVKVLRIASYMCNSGYRINVFENEKASFGTTMQSDIFGVNHGDIVLAAFVVMMTNADNFNLSDWVKYKDLIKEEDLLIAKKLAVILKIAESLDITHFGSVIDINCDILGDSVIMKTVVKEPAELEIKHAMLSSNEFKKAFNKNLEIL